MRWVIDQRTPLPTYVQAVLTHGQQAAGDALQILPATQTREACDVFVQPNPFANEPALMAHFFQPNIRRWAYVEDWPTPTRTNMARYVWLKRFHTILTPDVETGQRWLKNADVRWLTPEETWREFAPHAANTPPRLPHIIIVASPDAYDLVRELNRLARVDYLSDHTPLAIRHAARPCDARLFFIADRAADAWVYELAHRLGGVLLVHGEGLGNLWHERYGLAATATLASRELGRNVSAAEMLTWLQEPHTCPVRLLDGAKRMVTCLPILEKPAAQARGDVLPLACAAGYPKTTVRVLLHAPTPETIQALDLLVSWGFPFQATWFGKMPKPLRTLAKRYGLGRHITECRRKGLASLAFDETDVALFWRPFARGGGAEEISIFRHYGVPTVCTNAEARLLGMPSFLRIVPDRLSPLLIAEAIVEAASWPRDDVKAACVAHRQEHSPERLAARVLQALGLHG